MDPGLAATIIIGLTAGGLSILAIPNNQHFGLAKLSFGGAAAVTIGQLLWWGIHVKMTLPGRLIVVMGLAAVLAGVTVEAFRWVGRVEKAGEATEAPKVENGAAQVAAPREAPRPSGATQPEASAHISADQGAPASNPTPQENKAAIESPAEARPALPLQTGTLSISPEQTRILAHEFFELRRELAGIWVDRPMNGSSSGAFSAIMEAMNRAGIEAVSDLQNPSTPDQTGLVICVPDPAHPTEVAKRLRGAFNKVGIETTFDVISDRQRLRPNDAPSLVIYVAPPPL